jgi:hypothetical protein
MMASREDLVMRFVFSFLLAIMTGINVWQYVTSQPDHNRPKLKLVFLLEALITALAGIYLVVSTAYLLA